MSCSKAKSRRVSEPVDRISTLPDNVISHILSFLTTKNAVATTKLSKGWKDHWKSVDNIDIDYEHAQNASRGSIDYRLLKNLQRFIKMVIMNYEPKNLRKLRLICSGYTYTTFTTCLYDLIDMALNRNVKEVELDINEKLFNKLRYGFFLCKTIQVLKLSVENAFGTFICNHYFPSLKVLHIRFRKVQKMIPHDASRRLINRCPLLEDMTVEIAPSDYTKATFIISQPSLKRLSILVTDELNDECLYKFVVKCPELETLHLRDDSMVCKLVGSSLSRLKHTSLMLGTSEVHKSFDGAGNFVLQRLKEVGNTGHLSMSHLTTAALVRNLSSKLPCFSCLGFLEVAIHDHLVRWLLPKLLDSSPKLEVLILQMENNLEHPEWAWDKCIYDKVPSCLLEKLKTVRIKSFRGEDVENDVIKFLLENGIVLEQMILHPLEVQFMKEFSKEKIFEWPRASTLCHIDIL